MLAFASPPSPPSPRLWRGARATRAGYPLYRSKGDDKYTSEIEDIPLPKPPITFWQTKSAPDEVKRHFEEFEWDEDLLTTEPMTPIVIQQGNVKVCPTCCKWYIVSHYAVCGLYSWIADHGTCPNCNAPLSLAQLKTIPYESWEKRYSAWLDHEYVNAYKQHAPAGEEEANHHIQRNKQLECIKEQIALVMRAFLAYCMFMQGVVTMRIWIKVLQTEQDLTKGFKFRKRALKIALEKCDHIVSYDERLLCPEFANLAGDVKGEDYPIGVPAMLDMMKDMKESFHSREEQIKRLVRDHKDDINEVYAMFISPFKEEIASENAAFARFRSPPPAFGAEWPKLIFESLKPGEDIESLKYTCYIFFSENDCHKVMNSVHY